MNIYYLSKGTLATTSKKVVANVTHLRHLLRFLINTHVSLHGKVVLLIHNQEFLSHNI